MLFFWDFDSQSMKYESLAKYPDMNQTLYNDWYLWILFLLVAVDENTFTAIVWSARRDGHVTCNKITI